MSNRTQLIRTLIKRRSTFLVGVGAMLAVGLGAGASACILDGGSSSPPPPATLTVENHSRFIIREVHLAAVNNDSWGPDLLSRDLRPDEGVVVDNIACGSYDVLVVDETNLSCVLPNIRLCFSDAVWAISDGTLDRCAFPA